MLLAEELIKSQTQSQRRATAHLFDVLLQELDLEAWHQALRELTDLSAAVGELLPLVGCEEAEFGGDVGRRVGEAEMDAGHRCGPRIDVGGQQARLAHERIDQAALAGFDLPNDADAAGEAIEQAQCVVDEGAAL